MLDAAKPICILMSGIFLVIAYHPDRQELNQLMGERSLSTFRAPKFDPSEVKFQPIPPTELFITNK